MIINSVRMKNIKSYGEGPDGNGITVLFQAGINRIAGLNGNGKSTLIECIGYALFGAKPVFEENFKPDTYFLRHGAKCGEMDVTFSINGGTYTVERGIGPQNKRRAKAVQVCDGSICAEGDKELADFLCRTFGLPEHGRLSEMFSKLIGVKQGRLAWPFDTKSAESKRFFEPLLDVEIFRQCFDRLKPVSDQFAGARAEHEKKLAVSDERIRERSDSPKALAAAQLKVSELKTAMTVALEARDKALVEKTQQEALERALHEATRARELSESAWKTAMEKHQESLESVANAERAGKAVQDSAAAHEAYESAESALKDLYDKMKIRDGLRQSRDADETVRKEWVAKARSARGQAGLLSSQRKEKGDLADGLIELIHPLRAELADRWEEFQTSQASAKVAKADHVAVSAWAQDLSRVVGRLKDTADDVNCAAAAISSWDQEKYETAQKTERLAREDMNRIGTELARRRERRTTIADQLMQIGSGICPFLKKTCMQFSPEEVQADLAALDLEIQDIELQAENAESAHEDALHNLNLMSTSESKLALHREKLAKAVLAYSSELSYVRPDEIRDAISRLCSWNSEIAICPAFTAVPQAKLDSDDIPPLQAALQECASAAGAWWSGASIAVQQQLERVEELKLERFEKENNLKNRTSQLNDIEAEIITLGNSADEKTREANHCDEQAALYALKVSDCDKQMIPFAALDVEIGVQEERRHDSKHGYELYLKSKDLADDLGARRNRLLQCRDEELAADITNKEMDALLQGARAAHDPESLRAARENYEKCCERVTTVDVNLGHAISDQLSEERRFGELLEARKISDQENLGIRRCNAAIELTEMARKTLRDAAPEVAQHLCNHISVRAQSVFNQISTEPIELEWRADNYSLRITPDERRFAMLSGGEQTKLALSMTLAMVEEFSSLRFCIFDEPTYGVDAESRRKLAEAIIEANRAAGLDQLLLVSHDDAFDGIIEHSILLNKSAGKGTRVDLVQ